MDFAVNGNLGKPTKTLLIRFSFDVPGEHSLIMSRYLLTHTISFGFFLILQNQNLLQLVCHDIFRQRDRMNEYPHNPWFALKLLDVMF